MMHPTKHRWFAFSLRTLFVVVTLLGILLGYELNWMRERRAMIARCQFVTHHRIEGASIDMPPVRAPGFLWLFGEQGYAHLFLKFNASNERKLTSAEQAEVEQAIRLFPEAKAGDILGYAGP